jgi:hypothetical protein
MRPVPLAVRILRLVLGRASLVVAGLLVPASVHAHFILLTPESWMPQDGFGYPQKHGPCGNEGTGAPTGAVTAFRPGETISVTINEVVAHPGHYRVALAVNDRSELPADPLVTPSASDQCASAAIADPPVFPVLADNVLPHTAPLAGPQTFTVTLPSDVSCTSCTLQVLEFMSRHPAPCFYYHCADISIAGAPVSNTTTTTLPCFTPRCSLEAVTQGPACGSETIPEVIRHKLDRASELLEDAETRRPGKAQALRRKAKRALKRAGRAALRSSRKARLSPGCAASIKGMTDRLVHAI